MKKTYVTAFLLLSGASFFVYGSEHEKDKNSLSGKFAHSGCYLPVTIQEASKPQRVKNTDSKDGNSGIVGGIILAFASPYIFKTVKSNTKGKTVKSNTNGVRNVWGNPHIKAQPKL